MSLLDIKSTMPAFYLSDSDQNRYQNDKRSSLYEKYVISWILKYMKKPNFY